VANCCSPFTGCRVNNDCSSTPTTPICNTTTAACVGCGSNTDCVPGSICTATGACLQGCASDSSCGTGEQCLTGANGKFCGPTGSVPTVALTPATGTFIRAGGSAASAFPTHLTVTLSFTVTTASTVTVTAADPDVTIANGGIVTIAAGQTSGEVQLSATAPHLAEKLTATFGASTSSATVRVLGATEQPAQLTLAPATASLFAGGNQTFTLTSDIPVPAATTVALDYGANAALFNGPPASVAFTADATVQTFAVSVNAAAAAGSSTITATLGTLTAQANVTVTAVVAGSCAPVNSPLVISMIYGDGGFTGTATASPALWQSDFVEIHNRTTQPQSLTGLSVQYVPATSTSNPSGVVTLTGSTLAPGAYYLLALTCSSTGCGAGGSPLPTPDQSSSTVNMSFSNGKVFLVNGTSAISYDATGAPTAASAPLVLDAVGYGVTNYGENNTKAPVGTSSPDFRKNSGCTDTNDNAADWDFASPPTPRNTSSPALTCAACGGTQ
jgi:hypothetical protein